MKSILSKILAVLALVLVADVALGDETWSGKNAEKKNNVDGNVTIERVNFITDSKITIPSGSTVTITGNLTINSDQTLVVNGTLIVKGTVTNKGTFTNNGTLSVSGNVANSGTLTTNKDLSIPGTLSGSGTLKLSVSNLKLTVGSANSTVKVEMGNNATIESKNGDLKLGSVTVGANSSITSKGDLTTTGGTIGNNTNLNIGGSFTNGSTLTINDDLDIPGNLTNNGTITIMDSHLTVGTYDEEGGLVSGGNTENNGTINITSTSSSAQDDKVSSLISNNITNNGGADINLNSGYLVANNDINLEYRSDLNYSSGESYVVAYNNVNQESYAGVNLNNGSKGTMLVKNEYHDDSSSDNHPWGFDSSTDPFSIWVDKDFNLLIGEYFYDNNMAITGLKALYLFDGDSRDEIDELFNNLKKTGINKENIEQTLEKIEEALPIELVYFRAQQIDGNVEFTWQTASELNNDYFTIEYSLNAIDFEELAIVTGSGTTTETVDYQYTDFSTPESGTVYYRLKQTDYDGNYTYSDMVAVVHDKKQFVENPVNIVVYPNPATVIINVDGQFERIAVCDFYGRVLFVASHGEKSLNVSTLKPGTYYVKVTVAGNDRLIPFVKR